MPLLIQTASSRTDAYTSQRTRLDGRDYLLRFRYNERENRWYLSIYDEEEEPILLGLKIVANWRLLKPYKYDPNVPPGELIAVDMTGNGSPPGLDELGEGRRCELLYLTREELAERE